MIKSIVLLSNNMPRKDHSLAEKIAILDQIKDQPPQTSHRRLAEITGVSKSTIARLMQQQNQLREEWVHNGKQGASQKRKRRGKNPDVEAALSQWFSVVSQQGICVNRRILKEKSEELAQKLGHYDFKATEGWLSRWRCRNEMELKKTRGGNNSANVLSAEEWKSKTLPMLLKNFQADDIYCASETGLFYQALPNGSLCDDYVEQWGSKRAMDCVTVLCCSNMTGRDKKKLLVVGTNAMPVFFMDSLPVEYHASKNTLMTADIFKQWLINWDVEVSRNSRKILLIISKCMIHPKCSADLKSIQLEFLPDSKTSLVQPFDMGILRNLKTFYHGKLVNYILGCIDGNLSSSYSAAREVSSKISLLQAVLFLADSWREISCSIIQKCFSQSGFKYSSVDILEKSEVEFSESNEVKNIGEDGNIHCNIECYGSDDNCEGDIVETILSEQESVDTGGEENVGEEDRSESFQVTTQDAINLIDGLRCYFMQEGNEGSPMAALDTCADFVHKMRLKKIQQDTLDKKGGSS